ncbi:MAG TPA: hypothetical protein VNJ08_10940 [Bacteriovoracaceae bacterium]|nr:hypothetical protein [Bacteriovoracaceae bacterium]
MLKLCTLVILLTASAYSHSQTTSEDTGPTLPLIKEVHNAEERRVHVGLNFGINNPEGRRGATPELGLDVGLQPLIPFGLGFELSTSRFDASQDEMHRRLTAMIRGTYNFGGDTPVIKYSYFGLATGAVMLHDGTEFGIAPVIGFDTPLYQDCSLGFMAKYLFVTSKDPDSLMTAASLKYWY